MFVEIILSQISCFKLFLRISMRELTECSNSIQIDQLREYSNELKMLERFCAATFISLWGTRVAEVRWLTSCKSSFNRLKKSQMFMEGSRRDTHKQKKMQMPSAEWKAFTLDPALSLYLEGVALAHCWWLVSLFSLKRNQVGVGCVWLLSCNCLRSITRPLF